MQKTNIVKTRIVKEEVFRKILEDKKLRDILIIVTGIRDSGVCSFARRRSQNRIKNEDILNAIRKYTGWNDNQIFEKIGSENFNSWEQVNSN
ncbi:hypothetical protein D1631_05675 [Chryseobacterium nematophagum]|uniref:Uncharacterized protein n=1 Tax=Chryseobacterium nematophagum TaxID=2305228 RepID=A0A3M7TDU6_9FLAO|nr:hypothetical protein [Chryseobacterium nematophagum]RNA61458.1 hypothetical protein D1631_05675 [Chryseobacterium nematophagum]